MVQIAKNPVASAGGGWIPQVKTGFQLLLTPKGAGDFKQICQFALWSVTFPQTGEVEAKEIKLYNLIRKYAAGAVKFDNASLKLLDYVDKKTFEAMETWHKAVFDPSSGAIFNPSDYKVNATLILGTVDNRTNLDRKWTYHGLWPTVVKMGEGEMGNGDQVQIEATLAFDWIDHEEQ